MARDERVTLLEVYQALPEEQFQSLKFLLEGRIPAGLLHLASRPDLCRILLQRFPGNSLRVTAEILRQLGRLDLIQRFQLPLEEQIPEETSQEPNGDPPEARGDPTPGCHPGGIPAPPANPRRLTEKDLMQIAQRLGKEWQEVGILHLGLERSRLEQIQEEIPGNAVLRNFEMLREWRQRERHEATASRLRSCLEPARLDPGILDFLQSLQGN
ncbi:CRADD protein, partial [Ptilonorhynchus violaceus]|nr:CRADD protein [Ptilonorhynchus violaceus]